MKNSDQIFQCTHCLQTRVSLKMTGIGFRVTKKVDIENRGGWLFMKMVMSRIEDSMSGSFHIKSVKEPESIDHLMGSMPMIV